VNDNYKEFGKRKFLHITGKKSESDFEPKSKSLRESTLEVRTQIRITYRPTEEECRGLKPFEEEGFKSWLASLPRETLEIGSCDVQDLTREELETKLLSVAKNEPQPPGPPFIGHFTYKPKVKSGSRKKAQGL
jgi:hypothetical protein